MSDAAMIDEYDTAQRFAICAKQWSDRNMNIEIKNSLNNYSARKVLHQGREHLIVPATAMVEGVHCGSRGCLFYSTEILANFANAWNGVQVLIGHPDNGGFCNDSETINSQAIGQAFNFHMIGNKLKCEFWIDAQRLIELNNELYNNIINARPVEISTGLGIGNLGDGGMWNGEEYAGAVLDMQPDHIAILPSDIGACSIQDGCGIRNSGINSAEEDSNEMNNDINIENVNSPKYDGTETISWEGVDKSLKSYINGYYKNTGASRPSEPVTGVRNMPQAMKNWIALKTLNGDRNASDAAKLISYPVVNPSTNKLNRGAVIAAKARATQQNQTAIANKANSLFKKEFKVGNMMEKIGDMFNGIFNTKKHSQCNEMSLTDLHAKMVAHLDSMDDDMKRFYLVELFNDYVIYKIKPGPMAHSGTQPIMFQAEYTINDNGVIELGEPKQVIQEINYRVIENDSDKNINNDSIIDTKPQNKGGDKQMDEKQKKEMIDGLIACNHTQWTEDDRDKLNSMDDEVIAKLSVVNIECNDNKEDKVENDTTGNDKVENASDGNTDDDSTVEDAVAKLSPEHQRALNEALRIANNRKAEIIAVIKNADGNKFTDDELDSKEIVELENIAALIQDKSDNNPKPSYAVNAGRHMHVINDDDNDKPLAVVNGFDALIDEKK